jgi:DUF2934 family protein
MPRKNNPEKDIVITSGGVAAARPKRTIAASRAKRPAATTASPAISEPEEETVTSVTAFVTKRQLSHEEIARVAYSLWEARGCQHGSAEEDWRRAEEQLRQLSRAAGV